LVPHPDDPRFLSITPRAALATAGGLTIRVDPAAAPKCERCWHWREDVGHDPRRPELCGRCTNDDDLCGGESRRVA
jgi:isoleucyl-tRNA synthetase